MTEVLTTKEVASLLRVSRDTVYRLAARGDLPGRKIGRIWRFPGDALESYIREQRADSPRNRDVTADQSGRSQSSTDGIRATQALT